MRHPTDFRAYRRQPGHYTRFEVTSGLPVTRPQPRIIAASYQWYSLSALAFYRFLRRIDVL
jgi:hypothetical protein